MARIRSIKPEFPQSETIGDLSRDARLLFIQLWTIVDDEGRARAASRMLASLLYPYDDDAPALIEGWLAELERTECIRRYEVDGSRYLQILNWLKHQKIDKPSKSRLPEIQASFANPREPSRKVAPDLGPRTLDLGVDQGGGARAREPGNVPDYYEASVRIVEAMGEDKDEPRWFGQRQRIAAWLPQWDLELDILPTVKRLADEHRTAGRRAITTFKYFEAAIADAHATRNAPLPQGTPEKRHAKPETLPDAARRLAASGTVFSERPRVPGPEPDSGDVKLLAARGGG